MKRCPKCGQCDVSKFGKDRSRNDGLATYCRACFRAIDRIRKPRVFDGKLNQSKTRKALKERAQITKYGETIAEILQNTDFDGSGFDVERWKSENL